MNRHPNLKQIVIAAMAALVLAGSAQAVTPRRFVEESPDAYTQGAGENIIWNQQGAMTLGRDMKALLRNQRPGLDYVTAMTTAPDGSIYAVGGNQGNVFRIAGDAIQLVATLHDTVLFSVAAADDGTIYVGSGGTNARIWKIAPDGKPTAFFRDPNIAYYWALAITPGGRLLAATGAGGKLLNIDQDGKANLVLESEQKHLRSLHLARSGDIYVGTDSQAVLYRIDAQGKPFIVHHGEQAEITAITSDEQGNIYFAAATPGAAPGTAPEGFPSIQSLTLSRFINAKPAEDKPENGQSKPDGNDAPQPAPQTTPPAGAVEPTRQGKITPQQHAGAATARQASSVEPALGRYDPALGNHATRSTQTTAQAAASAAAPQPAATEAATPSPAQNNDASPPAVAQPPAAAAARQAARTTRAPARTATAAAGNAVYRVTLDGMTRKLYATPEGMLLALLVDDGMLMVGSTVGGQIIAINLETETITAVARAESNQVSALARAADGSVVIGTADPGALYRLEKGLCLSGGYVSKVHDAGMSAKFGRLSAMLDLPPGTKVTFSTRSGNIAEADDRTWSPWSDEIRSGDSVASPPARYLQLRATFATDDARTSPVMRRVAVAYLQGNQPPVITQFEEGPRQEQARRAVAGKLPPDADTPPPPRVVSLVWQATDPNEDDLRFSLFQRKAEEGPWILIDSDLIESRYQWATAGMAEGNYELLLLAGDAASNPPGAELSAIKTLGPVLVDNGQPTIHDLKITQQDGALRIRAVVRDTASDIALLRYVVDGNRNWRPLMPVDGICDSKEETLDVLVPLPERGHRVITLQAFDEAGNSATSSVNLIIE